MRTTVHLTFHSNDFDEREKQNKDQTKEARIDQTGVLKSPLALSPHHDTVVAVVTGTMPHTAAVATCLQSVSKFLKGRSSGNLSTQLIF